MSIERGQIRSVGKIGSVNVHRGGKPKFDEGELRRNLLSVRFKDNEHQAVTDEAWRNRMTASGWLRELALEHLKNKKVLVDAA